MSSPAIPSWALRAAIGAAVVHAAWLVAVVGGRGTTQLVDNVAMALASLAAGLACLVAWRRLRGSAGRAWLLIGLGCLSWTIGQATWATYEHVLQVLAPYPSWADAGYFGMIPLTAAGLLFLGGRDSAPLRARDVLDGLIMGGALLLVLWPTVLDPTYDFTEMTPFAKSLSLAYPVGDVLLATLVLLRMRRHAAAERLAPMLLAAGLVALSTAHMFYASLIIQGTYFTGHVIDIGWFSGFLVVGLGALAARRPARMAEAGPERASAWDVALPYLPLTAAAIVTGSSQVVNGHIDPFAFWLSATVVTFVAGRQMLALADNARLTTQLSAAVDRLRETQASRIRLIHGLAHDLRGPLSPMVIQLRLLQSVQPPLAAAEARRVAMVQRNTDRLAAMMEDLRDVVRLEEGDLKVERKALDLAHQAGLVAETFTDLAKERGVLLAIDAAGPLPVQGDADRLQRVVHNLLGNAIKFTPAGGTIRIIAKAEGPEATVRIIDTGPGLTVEQRGRLFQAFSQVHDLAATTEKGTGLGLYISKGILQQHGGRIWCDSDGPGKGTTFAFALPLSAGTAA